jgi:hypothetical protein
MSDIIGALLAAIGLLVTLTAFFTVTELLFPARIERIREVADEQPGRSLLLGSVNLLFFGAIALVFIGVAEDTGMDILALPGLLIAGVLALALAFGLTAVVQLLGERTTPGGSRLRRSISGSLGLILACLTPFIGWFALLPYAAILGLGAVILALVHGRKRST